MALTRGEAFNRGRTLSQIQKAAPALLSEHLAPQFRLKQRLYSDDAIGVLLLELFGVIFQSYLA
jgi:hypothetical protein